MEGTQIRSALPDEPIDQAREDSIRWTHAGLPTADFYLSTMSECVHNGCPRAHSRNKT